MASFASNRLIGPDQDSRGRLVHVAKGGKELNQAGMLLYVSDTGEYLLQIHERGGYAFLGGYVDTDDRTIFQTACRCVAEVTNGAIDSNNIGKSDPIDYSAVGGTAASAASAVSDEDAMRRQLENLIDRLDRNGAFDFGDSRNSAKAKSNRSIEGSRKYLSQLGETSDCFDDKRAKFRLYLTPTRSECINFGKLGGGRGIVRGLVGSGGGIGGGYRPNGPNGPNGPHGPTSSNRRTIVAMYPHELIEMLLNPTIGKIGAMALFDNEDVNRRSIKFGVLRHLASTHRPILDEILGREVDPNSKASIRSKNVTDSWKEPRTLLKKKDRPLGTLIRRLDKR